METILPSQEKHKPLRPNSILALPTEKNMCVTKKSIQESESFTKYDDDMMSNKFIEELSLDFLSKIPFSKNDGVEQTASLETSLNIFASLSELYADLENIPPSIYEFMDSGSSPMQISLHSYLPDLDQVTTPESYLTQYFNDENIKREVFVDSRPEVENLVKDSTILSRSEQAFLDSLHPETPSYARVPIAMLQDLISAQSNEVFRRNDDSIFDESVSENIGNEHIELDETRQREFGTKQNEIKYLPESRSSSIIQTFVDTQEMERLVDHIIESKNEGDGPLIEQSLIDSQILQAPNQYFKENKREGGSQLREGGSQLIEKSSSNVQLIEKSSSNDIINLESDAHIRVNGITKGGTPHTKCSLESNQFSQESSEYVIDVKFPHYKRDNHSEPATPGKCIASKEDGINDIREQEEETNMIRLAKNQLLFASKTEISEKEDKGIIRIDSLHQNINELAKSKNLSEVKGPKVKDILQKGKSNSSSSFGSKRESLNNLKNKKETGHDEITITDFPRKEFRINLDRKESAVEADNYLPLYDVKNRLNGSLNSGFKTVNTLSPQISSISSNEYDYDIESTFFFALSEEEIHSKNGPYDAAFIPIALPRRRSAMLFSHGKGSAINIQTLRETPNSIYEMIQEESSTDSGQGIYMLNEDDQNTAARLKDENVLQAGYPHSSRVRNVSSEHEYYDTRGINEFPFKRSLYLGPLIENKITPRHDQTSSNEKFSNNVFLQNFDDEKNISQNEKFKNDHFRNKSRTMPKTKPFIFEEPSKEPLKRESCPYKIKDSLIGKPPSTSLNDSKVFLKGSSIENIGNIDERVQFLSFNGKNVIKRSSEIPKFESNFGINQKLSFDDEVSLDNTPNNNLKLTEYLPDKQSLFSFKHSCSASNSTESTYESTPSLDEESSPLQTINLDYHEPFGWIAEPKVHSNVYIHPKKVKKDLRYIPVREKSDVNIFGFKPQNIFHHVRRHNSSSRHSETRKNPLIRYHISKKESHELFSCPQDNLECSSEQNDSVSDISLSSINLNSYFKSKHVSRPENVRKSLDKKQSKVYRKDNFGLNTFSPSSSDTLKQDRIQSKSILYKDTGSNYFDDVVSFKPIKISKIEKGVIKSNSFQELVNGPFLRRTKYDKFSMEEQKLPNNYHPKFQANAFMAEMDLIKCGNLKIVNHDEKSSHACNIVPWVKFDSTRTTYRDDSLSSASRESLVFESKTFQVMIKDESHVWRVKDNGRNRQSLFPEF